MNTLFDFDEEETIVLEYDDETGIYLEEEPFNGGYCYNIRNDRSCLYSKWMKEKLSNLPNNCLEETKIYDIYYKFINNALSTKEHAVPYADYVEDTYSNYKPTFIPKSTGFLDKLNKSDTLVIHCQDSTTEMLSQIYEGKGWDVLRDGNIDKDELHELIKNHDRIVCLGHGTPSGLLNRQGAGYVIGEKEAPLLKDKKLFVIWCYAATFGKRYDLHGFFTDNMPSDSFEARWVGYQVSQEYMNDNITYWSKCCADVVDMAWDNPSEAAKKAVAEYLKVYGPNSGNNWNDQELGITKYNAERTLAI